MELRYLVKYLPPSQNPRLQPVVEQVLQYRTRDLNEEYRFVWTDWKDVPLVSE